MKTEEEILTNEILELRKLVSKKDEGINSLKQTNSSKATEIEELRESLTMVKFSGYSRLEDYKNTFENLKNIYKINFNYEIKNDWKK